MLIVGSPLAGWADESLSVEERKQRAIARFLPTTQADGTLVEQPFWTRYLVFRLQHYTQPHVFPVVAVDEAGNAFLLSRDTHQDQADTVLQTFNRIAQEETVVITRENVTSYLAFFLSTHVALPGLWLPDQAAVDAVLGSVWHAVESDALKQRYERQPLSLSVEEADGPFPANALTWEFWWGGVRRYVLRATREGTVQCTRELVGTQRKVETAPGAANPIR